MESTDDNCDDDNYDNHSGVERILYTCSDEFCSIKPIYRGYDEESLAPNSINLAMTEQLLKMD